MSKAFRFAIGAVLPLLLSALLTSCAVTASRSAPEAALDDRAADSILDRPLSPSTVADDPNELDELDEAVDLIGNPVINAVAKYKFDATGSLYEVHSPQTELPRLAPPKS